jgi:hypothetical protein
VIRALAADGWKVTDDPLTVGYGGRNLFVDLGADKGTVAAEKAGEKIAVEIQSFLNPSILFDLEHAVGQYMVYRVLLEKTHPARALFLAVTAEIFDVLMDEPIARLVLEKLMIRLLVFDDGTERIIQWTN